VGDEKMTTYGKGRLLKETIYHCSRCPHFKPQFIINPFKPLPGGCLEANIPIYDAKFGNIPERCPLPKEGDES